VRLELTNQLSEYTEKQRIDASRSTND
jgi:hypothetical protein